MGWFEALGLFKDPVAARAVPAATTAIATPATMAALITPILPEPDTPEQRDPFHGSALYRGRFAGRPQCRQQQRRFAQMRSAAILPVLAVSA